MNARKSWGSSDRHFLKVDSGGNATRIGKADAMQHAKKIGGMKLSTGENTALLLSTYGTAEPKPFDWMAEYAA